ncbi:HK97 family phage prohead protease [Streptomyces sp. NPDC001406]|uniref:HK97 family phage prohead protease n=1 Tax=Streptomyces sp. NPDC001406 TaxID=3364572 RepID=UPI003687C8DB
MSIQRLIVPAEWKAADDGDAGSLEGYLSTFGNTDLQGDVIEPGAFAKTVNRVNKEGVPLLADHNASVRDVLGTIVQASEDSHGLKIKAKFASDPDSQAIRQKLLDGHLKAMSIGYEPMEWGFREEDDGMRVRVLKEVKLWEGSVVVFPANTQALVTTVKAAVRSTIDTVIAGAVANGGDEHAIKAALAAYLTGEEETAPARDGGTDDAPAGDGDGAAKADTDPEAVKLKMYRADAVLRGDDPDAVLDPVAYAGVEARLDGIDEWLKVRTREAELSNERARIRTREAELTDEISKLRA